MVTKQGEEVIALYWDFENIHASLHEEKYGAGSYYKTRFRPQEALVDIAAVMDYAHSEGVVATAKAYANWQWLGSYRDALNDNALDLIQHFPRGMKNGADIRLSLDALEDIYRFPHITEVIVVGGDSDYISLGQKVKQAGLKIKGIGVRETTSQFWVNCCSEYKFYSNLIKQSATSLTLGDIKEKEEKEGGGEGELEDAKALLEKVMRRLERQRGSKSHPASAVKNLMLRLDPAFDESNYGFESFGDLIKACSEIVSHERTSSGGKILWKGDSPHASAGQQHPMLEYGRGENALPYLRLLRRSNIRLLPPEWSRPALECVEEIFNEAEQNTIHSFETLEKSVAERLKERNLEHDFVLVRRLRNNLFTVHQFCLLGEGKGIQLSSRNGSEPGYLQRSIELEITNHLLDHATPPLDIPQLTAILYGKEYTPEQQENVTALVSHLSSKE